MSTLTAAPRGPGGGTATIARKSSISPEDFAHLQTLLARESAIVLEPGKEYLVESRLGIVARSEGLAGIPELVQRSKIDKRTVQLVVDAMTTNETSFFRDVKPFDALRDHILPELIAQRKASGTRALDVWSMASSSGQESFSLAMLLREHFPEVADTWRVRIWGTDISPTMVARSRQGLYSQLEINRGLPASLLVKYFRRDELDWRLDDKTRSMCSFDELNLAQAWPATGKFDLVLCRNVLIYFSKETKQDILRRIRSVLVPGGHLMLGSSETTMNIDDGWSRRTFERVSSYQCSPGS